MNVKYAILERSLQGRLLCRQYGNCLERVGGGRKVDGSGLLRGGQRKRKLGSGVAVATQPGIIATIYLSPIACDAHLCGRALLKN